MISRRAVVLFAALAAAAGVAGPGLLLREERVCRDVSLRPGPGARLAPHGHAGELQALVVGVLEAAVVVTIADDKTMADAAKVMGEKHIAKRQCG